MPKIMSQEDFLGLSKPAVAILRVAALGDLVSLEPVVRYFKKKYNNHLIIWLLRKEFVEIFSKHPLLDYLVVVAHLEEGSELIKDDQESYSDNLVLATS
ncbi:MAG: hypothetical protein IJS50_01520 [Desulfovibrio sp.]|nr:hypothetical protein [Desulfovibrio sp.]